MKLIFLDFDGVLNDHSHMPNRYCGVRRDCIDELNRILLEVPDAQLVISSAWRYLVHSGAMTVKGFEALMQTHGADCFKRIEGVTETDEATAGCERGWDWLKEHGCEIRRKQIRDYVDSMGGPVFVVLDDLDIGMPELVQTNGLRGLTRENTDEVIRRLKY